MNLFDYLKFSMVSGNGQMPGAFTITIDKKIIKFLHDFSDFKKEIEIRKILLNENEIKNIEEIFNILRKGKFTSEEFQFHYKKIKDIKYNGDTLETISYVICSIGLIILQEYEGAPKIIKKFESTYKSLKEKYDKELDKTNGR